MAPSPAPQERKLWKYYVHIYLYKYLFVYLIQWPVDEAQSPKIHVSKWINENSFPNCHLGSPPAFSSSKFLSSSNYLCFSLLSPSELLCSFQFPDQGVLGSSEATWSISYCIKYFEHAERWSSLMRDGSLNTCKMLKNNNTSYPECLTTSRTWVNIIWGWNVTCVQPKWWTPTFYPLSSNFYFPLVLFFHLRPSPSYI